MGLSMKAQLKICSYCSAERSQLTSLAMPAFMTRSHTSLRLWNTSRAASTAPSIVGASGGVKVHPVPLGSSSAQSPACAWILCAGPLVVSVFVEGGGICGHYGLNCMILKLQKKHLQGCLEPTSFQTLGTCDSGRDAHDQSSMRRAMHKGDTTFQQ